MKKCETPSGRTDMHGKYIRGERVRGGWIRWYCDFCKKLLFTVRATPISKLSENGKRFRRHQLKKLTRPRSTGGVES